MFKYLCKKKAQSSLEYAILIIIVLGALLTIQVYIKRGVQGRLKSATDDIGDQYSTMSMNYKKTTRLWSNTHETSDATGTQSKLNKPEVSNTITTANVLHDKVGDEYWGKD